MTLMVPPIKRGERVRLTYEGRVVDAIVIVASPNGRSLMLQFEAILGGWIGKMPVLDEDGTGDFRDLLDRPVTVERWEHW